MEDINKLQSLAGIKESSDELKTFYAVYDRSTGSFIHLLDGKKLSGNWKNGKPQPFPQRSGLLDDLETAYNMMGKAQELAGPKGLDSTYANFDPAVIEIRMSYS